MLVVEFLRARTELSAGPPSAREERLTLLAERPPGGAAHGATAERLARCEFRHSLVVSVHSLRLPRTICAPEHVAAAAVSLEMVGVGLSGGGLAGKESVTNLSATRGLRPLAGNQVPPHQPLAGNQVPSSAPPAHPTGAILTRPSRHAAGEL